METGSNTINGYFNFTENFVYNFSTNETKSGYGNPISDIHINFSPPCGDTSKAYTQREIAIVNFMKNSNSDCKFEYNNSNAHFDYM